MEASCSFFSPEAESLLGMSLLGGTRRHQGFIINHSLNSKLAGIQETVPLLEIRLLEKGGSVICEAPVAGGARFCMSSMDE